jgi:hypothetical protein
MPVLEGAQGADKSRLAQRLAVRDEWFCGSLDLKSDDKTKAELLARAWIVECYELDGLNKATSQSLKRFLSTAIDTFQRAYGRDAGEYRRHCIIPWAPPMKEPICVTCRATGASGRSWSSESTLPGSVPMSITYGPRRRCGRRRASRLPLT